MQIAGAGAAGGDGGAAGNGGGARRGCLAPAAGSLSYPYWSKPYWSKQTDGLQQRGAPGPGPYLTESVYRVALQMSIPAQIRQLILYYYLYTYTEMAELREMAAERDAAVSRQQQVPNLCPTTGVPRAPPPRAPIGP